MILMLLVKRILFFFGVIGWKSMFFIIVFIVVWYRV